MNQMLGKSQDFKKVAECQHRNGQKLYYGLVKLNGKPIGRSIETADLAIARRRLGEFRAKAERLEGEDNRDIRFEELADERLVSIKSGLKPKPYDRRRVAPVGLMPFFRGMAVKGIGFAEIEAWKRKRGAPVSRHQELSRHLRCHRRRHERAAEIVGNRANSALVLAGDAGTLPKLGQDDDRNAFG